MSTLSAFELAYCALVMLLAYGLRGSTGFGGAIGMPLLALVLPMLIGIYIGDRIQVNLSEPTFRRIVCVTLFLCGIPLLLK